MWWRSFEIFFFTLIVLWILIYNSKVLMFSKRKNYKLFLSWYVFRSILQMNSGKNGLELHAFANRSLNLAISEWLIFNNEETIQKRTKEDLSVSRGGKTEFGNVLELPFFLLNRERTRLEEKKRSNKRPNPLPEAHGRAFSPYAYVERERRKA